MDHIIWDYLPPNLGFMPEFMLLFWNYAISSLHLRDSMLLSSSLLLYAKCNKFYSSFLLIIDLFLV
jgi:hypothetical protein